MSGNFFQVVRVAGPNGNPSAVVWVANADELGNAVSVDALPAASATLKGLIYYLTSDNKMYRVNAAGDDWEELGSSSTGGSGSSVKKTIQVTNDFAAGEAIYRKSDSTWARAKADAEATAEVLGVVESATETEFTVVFAGEIAGLSGLTDGEVYFLSDATAGLLSATEPTTPGTISKPVMVAIGETSAIVLILRGKLNYE